MPPTVPDAFDPHLSAAPAGPGAAAPGDLVAEALRTQRWHLGFEPALEARFEADTGAERSRHMVLAGVLALLIFDSFLLNDWLMRPEVMATALFWRVGVVTGLSGIALALVARGLPPRWREGLIACCLVLAMVGACMIFRHTTSPAGRFDPFILSLVFTAGNIALPLRFAPALLSSTACLAVAVLLVVGHPLMPTDGLPFLMGQMVGTALFTVLACYRIERSMRLSYLLLLREALRSEQALRTVDELSVLSQTDALTGVANRRAFDGLLAERWADARRQRAPLALLLADIDNFKRYNDRFGHPAGDACLRSVAGAMRASLREGDFIARLGGEEFVVLLQGPAAEQAEAAAERLRQTIEALRLPHDGQGGQAVVTVSVGVARQLPRTGDEPAALMAAADAALYQAKRSGRNRCCSAPDAAGAPLPA